MTFRQAFGHLPSRRTSPSFDRYQVILLIDAQKCEQLAKGCYAGGHSETQTHDLNVRNSDSLPLSHLRHPHLISTVIIVTIMIILTNNKANCTVVWQRNTLTLSNELATPVNNIDYNEYHCNKHLITTSNWTGHTMTKLNSSLFSYPIFLYDG